MSRRDRISYQTAMQRLPGYLEEHLPQNSYVMVFPVQAGGDEEKMVLGLRAEAAAEAARADRRKAGLRMAPGLPHPGHRETGASLHI